MPDDAGGKAMFDGFGSMGRASRPANRRRHGRGRGVLGVVGAALAGAGLVVMSVGGVASASGSWSPPTLVDSGHALTAVSCPTAKFCVAVDSAGRSVIHKRNRTWAAPQAIDSGGGGLPSVSCATTLFCVAVDASGNEVTYRYGTWLRPQSIDSGNALDAVSCLQARFCAAVDGAGGALVYDGIGWSAPTTIDFGNALEAVSCPTVNLCVAVDGTGNAFTYDGTSWSAATSVDSGNALTAVSCATASLCVAVDGTGNAFTFDGTSWSAGDSIDTGNVLSAVSCPTEYFCVAVDGSGNAFTFPPPIEITTTVLPGGTLDHTYSADLTATGGNPPYRWLAGLPKGLTLNRSTGAISGTPKRVGTFPVTARVFDQKIRTKFPTQDRASKVLSITVS